MPKRKSKPVSRILFSEIIQSGNHSSRRFVTEPLVRPTRKRRFCPQGGAALSGQLSKRFPIWSCTARSLPSRACYQTRWCALTLSSKMNRTISPITNPKSEIKNPKMNWLVCFLLHLSSFAKRQTPGRYPARRPTVFGLSSFDFIQKRLPDLLLCKARIV